MPLRDNPDDLQSMGAMALERDSLQIFLDGALALGQSTSLLGAAFHVLVHATEQLYLRRNNEGDFRPSVAVASHFRIFGKAAVVLRTQLDSTNGLVEQQKYNTEKHIHEGNILLALTAINDLYCSLMGLSPKISKLNQDLEKVMAKADHKVKLELESLNYPKAVEDWKGACDEWLHTSRRPAWVTESSNAMGPPTENADAE